jgi:hypothetical protein
MSARKTTTRSAAGDTKKKTRTKATRAQARPVLSPPTPSSGSPVERSASDRAAPAPRQAEPRVAPVPFPRKNQEPTEAEFVARLPVATGKKFESVRATLRKQRGVSEVLYFFGPKTGWAYRYLLAGHSLATVMIHGDRLVGIVALDEATLAQVDFSALSEVARQARQAAHGTPRLSWLDVPLDGSGAADFKVLVRAKLRSLAPDVSTSPVKLNGKAAPPPPPPPPTPRPVNGRHGRPSASKT